MIAEDLTQRGIEILQLKLPVKWQPTEIKDHKKSFLDNRKQHGIPFRPEMHRVI